MGGKEVAGVGCDGFAGGDLQVGGAGVKVRVQVQGGDVELGVVRVFPDEDGAGGFDHVHAIEEELDQSRRRECLVWSLRSQPEGQFSELARQGVSR